MTTATELQNAYRAIIRAELDANAAEAIVRSGASLQDYIGGLLEQAKSTTGAAVAVSAFVAGIVPGSQSLSDLKAFAELQLASYAKLGVANPALGPFEALGRSFAVDPTTKSAFAARYGELDTAAFVKHIYGELYCGKIPDGALDNLMAQVSYFTNLLTEAGVPDAVLCAKGAVLGQLIGYAFLDSEAGSRAVIDDQVAIALTRAAEGDAGAYGAPLPFVAKPCDVTPPSDPTPTSPPPPAPDTTPPVFTSGGLATIAENTPAATIAYQAVATDPSTPLVYGLAGADASLFSVDTATGAVRFLAAPDFETPQDSGADNVYDIDVIATDAAGNAASRSVAITVTDLVEAPSIWRASVDSGGVQGNGQSATASMSADGRYVAFQSLATNLVAGDANAAADIFLYDNTTKLTTRVSLDSSDAQATGASSLPNISGDGRYVAFRSVAANLVAGDSNGKADVFVRDILNHTTIRVSLSSAGLQGNGDANFPGISDDGRYVVFESKASDLVVGDLAGRDDLFLRDLLTNQTIRITGIGVDANEANSGSYMPMISADGNIVAFQSFASNLVPGDTNGDPDIFVFDRTANTIKRVSVDSLGAEADNGSYVYVSLSASGRYVAFQSLATNLVANDTNGVNDIFRHDLTSGETIRVSVDSNGNQADKASFAHAISANGRYVAFQSDATNLVAGDTNLSYDIFVRDIALGKTYRVSVDSAGGEGFGANPLALGNADSTSPSISDDGRYVSFTSLARNLVPGDTNGVRDIFVVDGQAQGWWFA